MRLLFAALILLGQSALAQDTTPYNPVLQSIQGTWIAQLSDGAGNVQLFEVGTFHPDGSYSGANVSPMHTEHKGVWVRTGDRKFLLTVMFFTFDANRVFNGIVKARVQITLAEDLNSYDSVAERVVMDPSARVLVVTPGIRGRSVRMLIEGPETPDQQQGGAGPLPGGRR
jgi:hypothetical protein